MHAALRSGSWSRPACLRWQAPCARPGQWRWACSRFARAPGIDPRCSCPGGQFVPVGGSSLLDSSCWIRACCVDVLRPACAAARAARRLASRERDSPRSASNPLVVSTPAATKPSARLIPRCPHLSRCVAERRCHMQPHMSVAPAIHMYVTELPPTARAPGGRMPARWNRQKESAPAEFYGYCSGPLPALSTPPPRHRILTNSSHESKPSCPPAIDPSVEKRRWTLKACKNRGRDGKRSDAS